MKSSKLTNSITDIALGAVGFYGGQMLGSYIPASVDRKIVSAGKIALGVIGASMVKGKMANYIEPVAVGVGLQGAMELVNEFRPGTFAVSGVDNRIRQIGYAPRQKVVYPSAAAMG